MSSSVCVRERAFQQSLVARYEGLGYIINKSLTLSYEGIVWYECLRIMN